MTTDRLTADGPHPATASAIADAVLAPLQAGGGRAYLGESVTQLDHALQAADLASAAASPKPLVIAALLHDVGWLLGASDDDHAGRSATFLARWLPPAVSQPVRLHVEAKRWLCATSPGYHGHLSDASRRTLVLQGGAMNAVEQAAFEAEPWSSDAVELRRWDDDAKIVGRVVADLDHWRPLLLEVLDGGRP